MLDRDALQLLAEGFYSGISGYSIRCETAGFDDLAISTSTPAFDAWLLQDAIPWLSAFFGCSSDAGADASAPLATLKLLFPSQRTGVTNADYALFRTALLDAAAQLTPPFKFNSAELAATGVRFDALRATYVTTLAPGFSRSRCTDAGPDASDGH